MATLTEAVPEVCEKEAYVRAYEVLDKWKHCERDVGSCLVYEKNKSRAENEGFPTVMQVGKDLGLSEQEVSAVLGWTTGDYRLINPIARGQEEVEFEDYPQGVKSKCRLHRAEVLPYVQVLGSALEKLPPASAARLYRGHRRAVELPPGAVLKMPGFTSVSYDMDSALQFATQANQGRSVKRSLLVFQESFSGRCISKLSARKREVEVLFPVDSCFEVAAAAAAADADAAAEAEKAAEELRKTMPEAEVKVVYLRQVESKEDAVILE